MRKRRAYTQKRENSHLWTQRDKKNEVQGYVDRREERRRLVEKLTHVLKVLVQIGGLLTSERFPFLPTLILNLSTFSVST